EAEEAEVRVVDAENRRSVWADCRLVVGGARLVRRPDLDQPGTGWREHLGDPEAVADFDQLAAGHNDLAAFGERGEREQDGRRVVVDDEGVLGAGEAAQAGGEVVVARASRAFSQVVLEVRVAG